MEVIKDSVLLFKSPKENSPVDPYVQVLAESGLSAACQPALGFVYVNQDAMYEALTHPDKYSALLITSQNGVKGILNAINKHSSHQDWIESFGESWQLLPTFVVGPATAEAVRQVGFRTIGEDSGNGETLFPLIKRTLSTGSKPVLYACGNLSREVLPSKMAEAGLELEGITVYETGQAADINDYLISLAASQKCPEFVVYFSPSGLKYTYEQMAKLDFPLRDIKFIAIGPTTEEALKSRGLGPASTAVKPTPDSVLQAIELIRHQ